MPHHTEIADALAHREAIDALTRLAWLLPTEDVQDALVMLRQRDRASRAPSVSFDRTRQGAAARVQQVLDRMRTAEAMPYDPEAQQ